MLNEVWTQAEPLVANLLVVTLTALLGSLAIAVPILIRRGVNSAVAYFESKTGIDLEKKWQDDLHRAMTSGALAAIEKVKAGLIADTQEAKVSVILDHVGRSVLDALDGLKPSQEVLVNLALAKLLTVETGASEVKTQA